MEVKVYFCANFLNENSEISVLKNTVIENGEKVYQLSKGTETTLAKLYADGWSLKHIVSAHISHVAFFLFMER